MSVKNKRLLILGGGTATLDLVRNAKEMGVYTIATDNIPTGVAKELADEQAMVSTTDFEGLEALVKEKNIDGVFCGPSEFNLRNLIAFCEKNNLPCYTTMDIWDRCANKDEFKQFCINNNVDCPRQYFVDENSTEEELDTVDYPVIVKPVDGSSSNGISVCNDKSTLRDACRFARETSGCKRIIVEKYIDNGGALFGARYILRDGEAYPYLLIDTYIVNSDNLISHLTFTPSKFTDYYMNNMDQCVRNMIKDLGLKNGTVFFQALPYNGKIYFHEMGYRLSGGMLFKFTVPLMGINDMKMMIRYALGEEMCTDEEIAKLDIRCSGKFGTQLTIPLRVGKISEIIGLDEVKSIPCVCDFIQYYHTGDCITENKMGTLGQHFGRFTLVADSKEELLEAVQKINDTLIIKDNDSDIMNVYPFECNRISE